MRELVFVGLGLYDEMSMSLRGLEEVRTADHVFVELYTSLLPGFSADGFVKLCGKSPIMVSRKEVEDENGRKLFDAARTGKTVFLVPGDPLMATTHVSLRVQAEREGLRTRVVHGASIVSAAIGLSGLHNYKFGKSVTIPFSDETSAKTPYETIAQNLRLGLHTLCLLDMKTEESRYMTVNEALNVLLDVEKSRRERVVTEATLAVGIARAGSSKPSVKADHVERLRSYNFGEPPHVLIFPGMLHFMETEALEVFADAPKQLREVCK